MEKIIMQLQKEVANFKNAGVMKKVIIIAVIIKLLEELFEFFTKEKEDAEKPR